MLKFCASCDRYLSEHFLKGKTVYIPKGSRLDPLAVVRLFRKGLRTDVLAQQFHVTPRRIQQIIAAQEPLK